MDESGPKQKSLQQEAKEFVGPKGIPGDLTNNHGGRSGFLRHPRTWGEITPLRTYQEYIRDKFNWNPAVADAVIAASNNALVTAYDSLIRRINSEIGGGVSNQIQADQVAATFGELEHFMRKLNSQ